MVLVFFPWTEPVKGGVGRLFFKTLDGCFPRWHGLHMILNRNYVKMAYKTMASMGNIIKGHNSRSLRTYLDDKDKDKKEDKTVHLPKM